MEETVIYEKPTCSACRAAIHMLDERGVPYRTVRYYDAPLTKKKLSELIKKMGIAPRELLSAKEPAYRELGIQAEELSDAEIVELMIEHPDLMQRPILERGGRAIVGRPPERILEFLKEA
jgi:arsenate reductase